MPRLTNNVIINRVYKSAYEECEKGVNNWAKKVKMLLDKFGFSNKWNDPKHINETAFLTTFKQRVIDCFYQK